MAVHDDLFITGHIGTTLTTQVDTDTHGPVVTLRPLVRGVAVHSQGENEEGCDSGREIKRDRVLRSLVPVRPH